MGDFAAILGTTAALLTDPMRIVVCLCVGWFPRTRWLGLAGAIGASLLIAFTYGGISLRLALAAIASGLILWGAGRALRRLTVARQR